MKNSKTNKNVTWALFVKSYYFSTYKQLLEMEIESLLKITIDIMKI